jgi:chromate transport protein ChrA
MSERHAILPEHGRIKMGEAHLSMFIEQFAAALVVAVVWLVIWKLIPRLRGRTGTSYLGAAVLAVAACLAVSGGVTPIALISAVIVLAILYMLYKRALKKRSFDAATIISYENRKIS